MKSAVLKKRSKEEIVKSLQAKAERKKIELELAIARAKKAETAIGATDRNYLIYYLGKILLREKLPQTVKNFLKVAILRKPPLAEKQFLLRDFLNDSKPKKKIEAKKENLASGGDDE